MPRCILNLSFWVRDYRSGPHMSVQNADGVQSFYKKRNGFSDDICDNFDEEKDMDVYGIAYFDDDGDSDEDNDENDDKNDDDGIDDNNNDVDDQETNNHYGVQALDNGVRACEIDNHVRDGNGCNRSDVSLNFSPRSVKAGL